MRKFHDFAAIKIPRFLPKLCSRPKPRDIDNSKTFDHLDQCIHVQVRSILSFMQSLTLIEEHNYIFLPYTFNYQSTMQNVATVFQSYNGREWLPERGIVHLNASPECIISSPGTDQNSSLLHVDFIPFDIAEHEWEWVGLCEMRRLHRLSITGIYARIGLGLSRACNNRSDWLIRGR